MTHTKSSSNNVLPNSKLRLLVLLPLLFTFWVFVWYYSIPEMVLSNQYNNYKDVSWLRFKQTIVESLPLKIFILVGQSNMQGHGYIDKKNGTTNRYLNGTLEWMIETHPEQYGKLKRRKERHTRKQYIEVEEEILEDKNHLLSSYVPRDDVWIVYNKQRYDSVKIEMNQYGPLVPGFGGDPGQFHMGPELGFGWTVGDEFKKQKQQILLLKVAWGGRSLAVEFRPPSSGGTTGLFYEAMMADTFKVLANLEQYFPDYGNIGSYEIAGFAWHQGWNDGCDDNMAKEYESNLANLIRDVRRDLGVPNLPVSIGVSGMVGYKTEKPGRREEIIDAQFAVANVTKYPEFAGTVAAVETRHFARPPPPASPGDQEYHWNNNCESYWLVGQAMAKAMIGLLKGRVYHHGISNDQAAYNLIEEKEGKR